MKHVPNFIWVISAAAVTLLYLPIFQVVIASFNASPTGVSWGGWTTQWYTKLGSNAQAMASLKVTMAVAALSTIISVILGTLTAIGLGRRQMRGKQFADGLLEAGLFIPDIVLAVGLLAVYALLRRWTSLFELGFATLVIGHVTFQLPFVVMAVRARMAGLDPSIEEAAQDLGANRIQTLVHVTLPMLAPGIRAGALLALTLSLDDFVVSFFTAGPGSTTLPVYIYSSVKRGLTPEIHALSTLLILAAVLASIGIVASQNARKDSV